ncbi:[FeFe] hydrogenase H-cluster maturation GTPase HydF, partial [Romboutsia ilealis]|nr:[FeFe] hydrogenase H-cluster maturation GTPase HydF [Romboutsia ilealis]
PGLDDTGELGDLRIQKAYQILNKTDIAVLIIDGTSGMTDVDTGILKRILKKGIPYVVVLNKSDLAPGSNTDFSERMPAVPSDRIIAVSTVTGENIHEL